MMFNQLKTLFNVYRAGQSVADELFLKKAQLTVNALAVLLIAVVALLRSFNVNIPLDDTQITQIAGTLFTIIGLFNAHATVASTDKFGMSSIGSPAGNTAYQSVSGAESTDVPSEPGLPSIPDKPTAWVPPIRHAANGDVLDGLDTTHNF
jgi:hypothetical protein